MRFPAVVRAARSVPFAVLLAGCGLFGSDKPAAPPIAVVGDTISTDTVAFPDGAGLRLPLRLDGFRRGDLAEGRRHDEVDVAYARSDGLPGAITVRVERVGGGHSLLSSPSPVATTPLSDRELRRALLRLTPDEAALRPGPVSGAFLLRFGAIQAGRSVTLSGPGGPVTITTWCCVHGIWSYSYIVRGADGPSVAAFKRDLPWSATTGASIAEAR